MCVCVCDMQHFICSKVPLPISVPLGVACGGIPCKYCTPLCYVNSDQNMKTKMRVICTIYLKKPSCDKNNKPLTFFCLSLGP